LLLRLLGALLTISMHSDEIIHLGKVLREETSLAGGSSKYDKYNKVLVQEFGWSITDIFVGLQSARDDVIQTSIDAKRLLEQSREKLVAVIDTPTQNFHTCERINYATRRLWTSKDRSTVQFLSDGNCCLLREDDLTVINCNRNRSTSPWTKPRKPVS